MVVTMVDKMVILKAYWMATMSMTIHLMVPLLGMCRMKVDIHLVQPIRWNFGDRTLQYDNLLCRLLQ